MRISINQPTFLPWMGYFRMIEKSDVFVFLDDVQFSKGSWQQRTKLPGKTLTVPIEKSPLNTLIHDIKLKRMPREHIEWINKHYHASPLLDMLQDVYSLNLEYLSNFNMRLIYAVCNELKFSLRFARSSELQIQSADPTDKLVKICQSFNADTYLSPIGSKAYLDTEQFNQAGIEVEWNIVPGQEGINEFSCVDHLLERKETPKGLTSEASSGLSDKG